MFFRIKYKKKIKKKKWPKQFPLTNDLNEKITNQPKRKEDLIPDCKCIVSSSYERDRELTILFETANIFQLKILIHRRDDFNTF